MLKINDYDFELLDRQNEFYKFAFSFVDEFKKIIQKYDGKMPSKRIETELKKLSNCFYYSKEPTFNWWHIKLYCPSEMRCISKPSRQNPEYHISEYIKDSDFAFVSYEKDEPINASAIIEKLEKNVAARLETIEKQEKARKNLEKLVAEFNDAGEKFKKASDALRVLNYVVKVENVLF